MIDELESDCDFRQLPPVLQTMTIFSGRKFIGANGIGLRASKGRREITHACWILIARLATGHGAHEMIDRRQSWGVIPSVGTTINFPHPRPAPLQKLIQDLRVHWPSDASVGRATRWQKGMSSPIPNGRPKIRLISEALRVMLAEVKPGDPQGRTYAELVAASLVETASSRGSRTSVAAAKEIIDRLEGRARQQIEVADVTRQLRDKSDYELQFYLDHGCWPEEEDDAPPIKV